MANEAAAQKLHECLRAWVGQVPSELNFNSETWVAIAAIIVSIVSLVLAMYSASLQRKHNRLSVLPIADIVCGDYEDSIFVKIKNVGIGPLFIERLEVREGSEWQNKALVEFMPDLPEDLSWADFTGRVSDIWLQPNGKISLVKLSGKDDCPVFMGSRDSVRKILGSLEVRVSYRDAYKHKLPTRSRKLDWFLRNIDDGSPQTNNYYTK